MQIRSLTLRARDLGRQRAFYGQTLGLPTEQDGETRLSVQVGSTQLMFEHDPAFLGFYHFAFTVPENQIEAAKTWLSARVPLLSDSAGQDLFAVEAFNTHNLYFDDADGNLAELIARHDLDNASDAPFGPASLLHLSEIGLVVRDVPATVRELGNRHGLNPYKGLSDTFTAVGDATGMFITVPQGRGWFPVGRPAPCAPFELTAQTAAGPLHHAHTCPEEASA